MSGSVPFDDLVVVDWSAAAVRRLGPDSCWIARGALHRGSRVTSTNYATRQEAAGAIEASLQKSLSAKRRTLVLVDVSFGLPAGAVKILQLEGKPAWRALWSGLARLIGDDEENRNNRFEVANALNTDCGTRLFWGRPYAKNFDHFTALPIKNVDVPGLAPNPLPRLRFCEELAGPGVISNWMLIGQGSVGGQVLTCLPYLERLRTTFGNDVGVWPFDGLDLDHQIVVAETWFGLFPWQKSRGSCRDEQQVRGTHRHFSSLSPQAMSDLFHPVALDVVSARRRAAILNEEGWTLGVDTRNEGLLG